MSGSKARLEYKEEAPVSYPFAETRREYLSLLNIDQPPTVIRGTGIICTIGPSSQEVNALQELIANGLNIARLNFSHGSYEVDMVFASFIRKASDVAEVRNALGEEGKSIKVIAKIENYEGVVNVDEIIAEADGIMVARGDMGMEMPAEKVFLAQKILITRGNRAGKPVICATQMLESMIKNPRPTRAEITDVGNAVVDGADCVMLSGETANGAYPIEAVAVMHKICRQAATVQFYKESFSEHLNKNHVTDATETTCIAAVAASFKALASAIIVLTTSGRTSWIMSKYRPQCPIIVITRNEQVARLCHLYRGLFPLVYSSPRIKTWHEDMFDRLEFGIAHGKDMGFIKTGSSVVFVNGCQPGTDSTNTVQIIQVDDKPISGTRFNANFCLI